jgi:hypothetical protein
MSMCFFTNRLCQYPDRINHSMRSIHPLAFHGIILSQIESVSLAALSVRYPVLSISSGVPLRPGPTGLPPSLVLPVKDLSFDLQSTTRFASGNLNVRTEHQVDGRFAETGN